LRGPVGAVRMADVTPDLPIACTLDPAALKARKAGLLQELIARSHSREEQDDGISFTFAAAPDLLPLMAEVIDAERRCCRFLRFELTVQPADGPVQLRLTGPAGTREFLRDLLPEEPAC
jgi:hypothetical protein